MADIAARREARRQRILENADNRLRRITNLHSDAPEVSSTVKSLLTRPEPVLNNVSSEEEADREPLQPNGVDVQAPPESESTLIPRDSPNYRIVVMLLLGACMRFMNLFLQKVEELAGLNLSLLYVKEVFTPLLTFEAVEMLIDGAPAAQHSPTFNFLLSLNNINPTKIKFLLTIFNLATSILRDATIYFFSFIIFDIVSSVS